MHGRNTAFLYLLASAFVAVPALSQPVASAAVAWPSLNPPAASRISVISEASVLNGRYSRIVLVESDLSPEVLAAHFRKQLGARHVEQQQKGAHILGGLMGQHFATVKIGPRPAGHSDALVMFTHVPGGRSKSPALMNAERDMPAGSIVAMTHETADAGTRALTVSALNKASVEANLDHVLAALQRSGYSISRRDAAARGSLPATNAWLSSSSGSAWVSVVDLGGQRAVTITKTQDPM